MEKVLVNFRGITCTDDDDDDDDDGLSCNITLQFELQSNNIWNTVVRAVTASTSKISTFFPHTLCLICDPHAFRSKHVDFPKEY